MANAASWFMFCLGIAHIVFGLVKFAGPVADAVSAGLIGQFAEPEVRRTAFWFLVFGPLLMLAGHVGIHAVAKGDLSLLKILGIYAFAIAVLGVAAFPQSPFWAPLLVAPVLIAVGYGWIAL
ncbi:hypothetical protein HZ993_21690 [Rhodoferax sp. AJA081-3]|uniref:DUF6463 family protein n=1 Tax=Rhodoferax sp. AJA081-3 TaxID=2752316 RepID=UPI001ADEDEA0|nr:DUF6463 family protein [Rhodoferax sp. AJA081-3]QTN27839.1 hypothetical protein HZ993_21690 [Rhodoferax sp. AJA081-3]